MNGLTGKRVLVTRARHQAQALCEALAACGAQPITFPTIDIRPVEDSAPADAAISTLTRYAWVVFTSANGVRHFLDRFDAVSTTTWPGRVRVAAVGPTTTRALEGRGMTVHAVPEGFLGERVPEALGSLRGQRVLLPRADIGRETIVQVLRTQGAEVDELTVYHTVPATPDADALADLRRGVDVVTFTSPSTVRNFLALLGAEAREILARVTVACIGPVTASAARELSLRVDLQPDEYTIAGLVEALQTRAAATR